MYPIYGNCKIISKSLSLLPLSPPPPFPPLPSTDGTSPPKPHAPVDEKQRLVSASYVNYGPTTNNGDPDHHRGVFTKSHGDGMLQSTLNDGFKTLFPNMRQRHHVPQQQGFPTSHIGLVGRGATPIGNNLMTGGNTATPPSSDWPDLKPQKSAIVDSK